MASSTSLEGELVVARQPQHKSVTRSTRQQRSQNRTKTFEQNSLARERTMSSSGVPLQCVENSGEKANKSPSSKNKHAKRNLREKRRPTGVVHILSTESTGGTSSGSEENLDDLDDIIAKRNAHFNEMTALAAAREKEESEGQSYAELRASNDKLKEQIVSKDDYIKKLEQRVLQLELQTAHQTN